MKTYIELEDYDPKKLESYNILYMAYFISGEYLHVNIYTE